MADGFEITRGSSTYACGRLRSYPNLKFELDDECRSIWTLVSQEEGKDKERQKAIETLRKRMNVEPGEDLLEKLVTKLHSHLGHPSHERMKETLIHSNIEMTTSQVEVILKGCEICKDKPHPNHPTPRGSNHPRIGLAEQDLTTFSLKGIGNAEWISVIYDMENCFIDAEPLTSKSDAHHHTARFLSRSPNIKVIRFDNAPELTGRNMKQVLSKHGVAMETTAPGSSFSNGGVERANRTLKQLIQVMMIDAGVIDWPSLWPWFVSAATHAHNHTYNKRVQGIPAELAGKKVECKFAFKDGVTFNNPVEGKEKDKIQKQRSGIFLAKDHDGSYDILEPRPAKDTLVRQVAHPRTVWGTSTTTALELLVSIKKIARGGPEKKETTERGKRRQMVRTILAQNNEGESYLCISQPWDSTVMAVQPNVRPQVPTYVNLRSLPIRAHVYAVKQGDRYTVLRIEKGHYLHGFGYVAEDEASPNDVMEGKFVDADNKEWQSIVDNEVLGEQVTEGEGRAIKTRFRRVYKSDGTAKTRFIVCATHDKRDVRTTTHLPMGYARRICHILGASKGWSAATVDVKTAFLLVPIESEVLIRLPDRIPEMAIKAGHVPSGIYKLRRALYGLKESPRLFEIFLTKVLEGLNYTKIDDGVFWRSKEPQAYLITYVDDILCWSSEPKRCLEEIQHQLPCAEIHDIGPKATRYIGEDIVSPDNETIITSMASYISTLPDPREDIGDLPVGYSSKVLTPRMLPLENHVENFEGLSTSEKELVIEKYRKLVGTIGWVATAHPSLSYRFGELARYSNSPGPTALRIALGALIELKQCKDLYIDLSTVTDPEIRFWIDASVRDTITRRGWVLQIVDHQEPLSSKRNMVAWRSVKDESRQTSSTAAETNAIYQAICDVEDVLFSIKAIMSRDFPKIPIIILTDSNSGRLQILNEKGSKTERTRADFIVDWMNRMEISHNDFRHVPGMINLADPLTKPVRLDWYNGETNLQ